MAPPREPLDPKTLLHALEKDVAHVEKYLHLNREKILKDIRERNRRPVIRTIMLPDTVAELFDQMGPGQAEETVLFYYVLELLAGN